MNKKTLYFVILLIIPGAIFAQNSIFDNSEATVGSIRNLSPYASTGIDAVIYNPAGIAFSEKSSQISLGIIGGYQQIVNKPYTISDNNDTIFGLSHRSSIIRNTPSIQAYSRSGSWTISWSFANEGGGGVWRDKDGNVVMDEYYNITVNNAGKLDNVQTLLNHYNYLINNEDVVRLNSADFKSKYNNYCIRIGVTYRIAHPFSFYLGLKTNMVHYSDTQSGQLYIHRPSTGERWLMSDYLRASTGLTTGINDSVYQNIQNAVEAESWGEDKTYAVSPVLGFAFKYNNLNIGLKYEMTSALFNDKKKIILPNDLSVGGSYGFMNNKLCLSAGADFKWGFCPNDSSSMTNTMVYIGNENNNNLLYAITLGVDYRISNNVLLSASTAFGNGCYSLRSSGSYVEMPVRINANMVRLSLGMQYQINEKLQMDMGCSINNPFYGMTMDVNTVNTFVSDGTIVTTHCVYKYNPRLSAGIGLTYSF